MKNLLIVLLVSVFAGNLDHVVGFGDIIGAITSCNAPANEPNGVTTCTSFTASNRVEDAATCSVTCNDGFGPDDVTLQEVVCDANSRNTLALATCVSRLAAGDACTAANGHLCASNAVCGPTNVCQCMAGYTNLNGECVTSSCNAPPAKSFGLVTCTSYTDATQTRVQPNAACSVMCFQGYVFDDPSMATATCSPRRTMNTFDVADCVLPLSLGATCTPETVSLCPAGDPNAACDATNICACVDGYTENAQGRCTLVPPPAPAATTPPTFPFDPIVTDPPADCAAAPIADGTLGTCVRADNTIAHGELCFPSCNEGYELAGQLTVECMSGMLDPVPACNLVTVALGGACSIDAGCAASDAMSACVLSVCSCVAGSTNVDGVCVADAATTTPMATSTGSAMCQVPTLANGVILCPTQGAMISPGSVCTATCDTGFRLADSSAAEFMCLSTGQLTGPAPMCIDPCGDGYQFVKSKKKKGPRRCRPCPRNTYRASGSGVARCEPCPPGTETAGTGAASVAECETIPTTAAPTTAVPTTASPTTAMPTTFSPTSSSMASTGTTFSSASTTTGAFGSTTSGAATTTEVEVEDLPPKKKKKGKKNGGKKGGKTKSLTTAAPTTTESEIELEEMTTVPPKKKKGNKKGKKNGGKKGGKTKKSVTTAVPTTTEVELEEMTTASPKTKKNGKGAGKKGAGGKNGKKGKKGKRRCPKGQQFEAGQGGEPGECEAP